MPLRRCLWVIAPIAASGWCLLARAAEPGLLVRVYEIDQTVYEVPQLAGGQLPNIVKVVPTLDLRGERGDFGLKDNFVTEVSGYLKIDPAGVYSFRLLSDDGSKLWIDDQLVIDHDGPHGPEPKLGRVVLGAGEHELRVQHFEMSGGDSLQLQWKLPNAAADAMHEFIPADRLTHDAAADRATADGKKRVIPPLRRGRPGDGSPVGIHPGYRKPAGVEWRSLPATSTNAAPPPRGSRWLHLGPNGAPIADRPVVWLPSDDLRPRFTDPQPLAGGFLVGCARSGALWRVAVDDSTTPPQGAVLRFCAGLPADFTELAIAVDGKITGQSPVRAGTPEQGVYFQLEPVKPGAFEIKLVRARSNGLELEFTEPLDARVGWEADSYYIEQWPYDLKTNAGPTRDGSTIAVTRASVAEDRRRVFLDIPGLKPAHVVYLRLLPPCLSEAGLLPWSTEVWYTLDRFSTATAGELRTPPPQPPQNLLTDAEKAEGWKLLFDGQTTRGWRGFRQKELPKGWQVVNGALVRVGPGGDIITDEQFDNFELKLEWRISAAGNSGVFYRVSEDEDTVWKTGPEMQVLDNAGHRDGGSGLTSAGSNYALHAPPRDVTSPLGLYNQVHIIADGPNVEYRLNGETTAKFVIGGPEWNKLVGASKFNSMPRFAKLAKGHIALQDHGDKVWFRNMKIRPLPARGKE